MQAEGANPSWFPSACAEHGFDGLNGSYTVLPYLVGVNSVNGNAASDGNGTLDGISIVESAELAKSATDPIGKGFYDSSGCEVGDKCSWTGLSGIFTAQGTFAIQPIPITFRLSITFGPC